MKIYDDFLYKEYWFEMTNGTLIRMICSINTQSEESYYECEYRYYKEVVIEEDINS